MELKERRVYVKSSHQKMLVIRVDDIGDYLLFRNCIEQIYVNKSAEYHITLLGNLAWKELFDVFDKDFVDEVIWLDKRKFNDDVEYKKNFLISLAQSYYNLVLVSAKSRYFLLEDLLSLAVNSDHKIANINDLSNAISTPVDERSIYNTFVQWHHKDVHESIFNKLFFRDALNINMNRALPHIDKKRIPVIGFSNEPYAVIFPGASLKMKRWSTGKFAAVADYLIDKKKLQIIIAGAEADRTYSSQIVKRSKNRNNITDCCGKTGLLELMALINGANILISNDTCAAHIGALTDVKSIIPLNGRHYGRFFPYPSQSNHVVPVYPKSFKSLITSTDIFNFQGRHNINDIKATEVTDKIDILLNNFQVAGHEDCHQL